MRVSFVVPTRNQASFLPRCLDSCQAQGLDEAEVIAADGRSPLAWARVAWGVLALYAYRAITTLGLRRAA